MSKRKPLTVVDSDDEVNPPTQKARHMLVAPEDVPETKQEKVQGVKETEQADSGTVVQRGVATRGNIRVDMTDCFLNAWYKHNPPITKQPPDTLTAPENVPLEQPPDTLTAPAHVPLAHINLAHFNPERYIVVDKQRREIDGDIHFLDVVRPPNEKYTTRQDVISVLFRRSTTCCPTYGNCTKCYRSGPTGMECQICNGGGKYAPHFVARKNGEQYIDAQWFSSKLGKSGHVTAKANRKVSWLVTPLQKVGSDLFRLIMNRMEVDKSFSKEEKQQVVNDARLEIWRELEEGW